MGTKTPLTQILHRIICKESNKAGPILFLILDVLLIYFYFIKCHKEKVYMIVGIEIDTYNRLIRLKELIYRESL